MTRGKVVLVAFPFDDLSAEKARPAICLTEPVGTHKHVVLGFVTSRVPDDPLDTDIALDPVDSDFAQTGLHVRSTIGCLEMPQRDEQREVRGGRRRHGRRD